MDNETTHLINDGEIKNVNSNPSSHNNSNVEEKRKANPIATAAGGFVAGAVAGAGATAYATHTNERLAVEEVANEEDNNQELENEIQEQGNTTTEERPAVEPTPVHEDKAPYHSEPSTHHSESSNTLEVTAHDEPAIQPVTANAEMIDGTPVDNEIRVLGVETVQTEDGHIMNVALLENAGDHALLVDVDNNGRMDVLLHDDNRDGMIQEQEVYDISGANLEVADLLQAHAQQESDVFYASTDDLPDYVNDADCIMEV
ncbi:MAG: hypothetical protein K2K81_01150 [Muribaculaceae bacterium]|nr:hypothetical protein [Muribaculaceae bacterium]